MYSVKAVIDNTDVAMLPNSVTSVYTSTSSNWTGSDAYLPIECTIGSTISIVVNYGGTTGTVTYEYTYDGSSTVVLTKTLP